MNTSKEKVQIPHWISTGLKAAGYIGLLFIPCLSYVLFEYVTGNLGTISTYAAVMNVAWYYVLYLTVFAWTGRSRIAIPVMAGFLYLVSVAETFVVLFRGRPIMFSDILAIQTAATVAGNYEFTITGAMVAAGNLTVLMILVSCLFPVRIRGWRYRLPVAGAGIALAGVFGGWFFLSEIPAKQLWINMWELEETYQEQGYVLSTMVSFQYLVKKKPAGYQTTQIDRIYREYAETETEAKSESKSEAPRDAGEEHDAGAEQGAGAIQPVNLICIMNESLTDLKVAGEFTTNEEYFPFLDSLQENTLKGSLCMPVFGAMTSNSEFEFLTGDSMGMLIPGSCAYQFNVDPGTYSLVSTLKDQGYQTIAMHPYPAKNWNRTDCYQNMGFDRFLDIEYYEGSEELRHYVSDLADYEKLIEVVEGKENPEDPLFIFNVTMQNHGGYDGEYDNFQQEIWLTGELEGKYPKTDQFLSLMKKSDEAFEALVEYFSQVSEPTMIVMFGDHQPGVEDEFYYEIAGKENWEFSDGEKLIWYKTPFVIWTNYETEAGEEEQLGAVYLSSEVLQRANLSLTPYNRFLLTMKEMLPVITPGGGFDTQGTYYTWAELENPESEYYDIIRDYEHLVYNHSFDPKKYSQMFLVP